MEGAQQRCDMRRLNISRAAAFCMSCRGLIAHTGRLARSHCSSLDDSRLVSIPQSGKCFAGGICTIWLLLVWRLQLTAHCPVWHKGSWFSVWVRWLSCLLKWQGLGTSVSWLEGTPAWFFIISASNDGCSSRQRWLPSIQWFVRLPGFQRVCKERINRALFKWHCQFNRSHDTRWSHGNWFGVQGKYRSLFSGVVDEVKWSPLMISDHGPS